VLESLWNNFVWLIGGQEPYEKLSAYQVIARAAVVYIAALIILRVGKRRFLGNYSAFDILLGFIMGSVMGRAITGAIRFVDMVLVVVVLMVLHLLLATVSYYWPGFSRVVESMPRKLIVDGEIQQDAMQRSKIDKNDLLQALREEGNIESPEEVKAAYLERDGKITVIPSRTGPHVVEAKVENGVQTIRIVIEHDKQ